MHPKYKGAQSTVTENKVKTIAPDYDIGKMKNQLVFMPQNIVKVEVKCKLSKLFSSLELKLPYC